MEHVQTKLEINRLLAAAGVRPRKRFGQHFLVDGNLMRRLVASADLVAEDRVLEVGGGTGGLTDLLVGRVKQVHCVEIDRDLQDILAERFRHETGFSLIRGDVLDRKHALKREVVDAIRARDPGDVKLVANLPYQIATPLVLNLLVDHPQVRRLCFTVQAEVGERIVSGPGCKAYGPVSILSQSLCRIERVARLSPSVFWPRPAVDSVMLRMDVTTTPLPDRDDLRRFAAFVRGVFDHRRKTLRSALAYVVDEATRDAVCCEVDGSRRPESFPVDEWIDMFHLVPREPE